MNIAGRTSSSGVRGLPGFTFIELLTVAAVVIIMLVILIPSVANTERARIVRCQYTVRASGLALLQYIADNRQTIPSYSNVDNRYLDYLHNNSPAGYEYTAYYGYQNLIAPYMGLGNCMPGNHPNWENAQYSVYKEFRCLSGEGLTSPQCDMYAPLPWYLRPKTSGFYPQNVNWWWWQGAHTSADGTFWPTGPYQSRYAGLSGSAWPAWPLASFQITMFIQPCVGILVCERWTAIGSPGGETGCQPYDTHFRVTDSGISAIGRTALYADGHVEFVPGLSDQPLIRDTRYGYPAVWHHGNEDGWELNSWYDGQPYIAWSLKEDLLEKG